MYELHCALLILFDLQLREGLMDPRVVRLIHFGDLGLGSRHMGMYNN